MDFYLQNLKIFILEIVRSSSSTVCYLFNPWKFIREVVILF